MASNDPDRRFPIEPLTAWCSGALQQAGARADIARATAEVLVEGDLLGHDTHGLALLVPYVEEMEHGRMRGDGAWTVMSQRPVAESWDGNRLPGPWLVRNALAVATRQAREFGTGSVAVGRSHHIACLAAYLQPVAEQGLLALVQSSDPAAAVIAPFGGTEGVISPNPVAAGIPTSTDPILIDVSTSITTNGLSSRSHKEGKKLPGAWLLDAEGRATDDPAVLFGEKRGTLLPLGGVQSGHKGFGLGLLVEAMTSALSGAGRAGPKVGWGASFFVQVIDPAAFAGREAFLREMDVLVDQSKNNRPVDPQNPPRLPGERGLARRREAMTHGVRLTPGIVASLIALAERFGSSEAFAGL